MSLKRNQYGLATLEVVLLLLLAAIIGFTGYKVYQSRQEVNKTSDSAVMTSLSQPSAEPDLPTVRSASDLDKSQAALDKENPDDNSADSSQLDSQTSSF